MCSQFVRIVQDKYILYTIEQKKICVRVKMVYTG